VQRLSTALAVVLPVLIAGCSSSGSNSGTINEEQYRKGLKIEVSVKGENVAVTVANAGAPQNLHHVHRAFLITTAGKHSLGESSGRLGTRITTQVPLSGIGESAESLRKVQLRYEVWDGEPLNGKKLFEGEMEKSFIGSPD
jgi:hypothetical protein